MPLEGSLILALTSGAIKSDSANCGGIYLRRLRGESYVTFAA
jgi:hypothetical protein